MRPVSVHAHLMRCTESRVLPVSDVEAIHIVGSYCMALVIERLLEIKKIIGGQDEHFILLWLFLSKDYPIRFSKSVYSFIYLLA